MNCSSINLLLEICSKVGIKEKAWINSIKWPQKGHPAAQASSNAHRHQGSFAKPRLIRDQDITRPWLHTPGPPGEISLVQMSRS
jgi:hypothetical protein